MARYTAVKMTSKEAAALYAKADAIAKAAADAMVPVPMIVGSAVSLMSDKIDHSKPTYYVPDGVCGFAWIDILPARGPFVTYLKSIGVGKKRDYGTGYYIWVSGYNQSMERKEAYASAFAGVLAEAGITAYPGSRMD